MHLDTLNVTNNKMITGDCIKHMKKIKILYACTQYIINLIEPIDQHVECEIDQQGIENLDLIELYVDRNTKINNVVFMKNTKILYANQSCGIDQQGISCLV